VPSMTYSGMPVAHGGQAVHAWNQLVSGTLSVDESEQLRADMLAYCEQDTLAMVEIWRVLQRGD
jgi:hypothetical protein